jgi:hypothetical protein
VYESGRSVQLVTVKREALLRVYTMHQRQAVFGIPAEHVHAKSRVIERSMCIASVGHEDIRCERWRDVIDVE